MNCGALSKKAEEPLASRGSHGVHRQGESTDGWSSTAVPERWTPRPHNGPGRQLQRTRAAAPQAWAGASSEKAGDVAGPGPAVRSDGQAQGTWSGGRGVAADRVWSARGDSRGARGWWVLE